MAKILVVDDQPIILLTVERILSHHKYEVLTANNVFDALEVLKKNDVDLVITDAIMLGRSGYDLSSTIRKTPKLQALPVIMLTGKRDKRFVEKGIEAGVNDYLIKPIDGELLITKVKHHLHKVENPLSIPNGTLVSWNAQWQDQTTVIQISNSGLLLRSQMKLAPDCEIHLSGPFYEELGVTPQKLKVTDCREDQSQNGCYLISTTFSQICSEDKEKIEKWIENQRRSLAS